LLSHFKMMHIFYTLLGTFEKVSTHEVTSLGIPTGEIRVYTGMWRAVTATMRLSTVTHLVTITIEYDTEEVKNMTYEKIQALETKIIGLLGINKPTKAIPAIKRGLKHDVYFPSSDGRLLEYDIQKMIHDQHSAYQHVQIAKSSNFGNMLVLDGMVNLAESDLAYTQSLMCQGKMDYTGKHVLILGGGDGALLHELLKENPAFITMIDIDSMVMQQCRKHLRAACGADLDTYKTEKYEVIIGDCFPHIKDYVNSGKKFDVIFGDLTDIPIKTAPEGETWDFVLKIIQLSFSILNKGGVYMTHATGAASKDNLKTFETAVIGRLGRPVSFTTSESHVPSFMEKWVFYQIREVEGVSDE